MYLLPSVKKDFSIFCRIIIQPNIPTKSFLSFKYEAMCITCHFIEDKETIFLKNIIPSRKYKKKYLEGAKHDS